MLRWIHKYILRIYQKKSIIKFLSLVSGLPSSNLGMAKSKQGAFNCRELIMARYMTQELGKWQKQNI